MLRRAVAFVGGVQGAACGPTVRDPASGARAWPAPGGVVRIVFAWTRGAPIALEELRTETWLRIGGDGRIDAARNRTTDALGRLEYESFFEGAAHRAHHAQLLPAPRHWSDTPGPRAREAVMWTEESVQDRLLRDGYRAAGTETIAGRRATRYERRMPFVYNPAQGFDSDVFFPVPVAALRATVTLVYVGRDPLGIDLGEAHYLVDDRGSQHPAGHRRALVHEDLRPEQVPAGAFDWPHRAA